jgi:hypothetical protein
MAESTGSFKVEVAAKESASGTYTVALEKVVTLATRLAPLRPVVESQRIQALRDSVERGDLHLVPSIFINSRSMARPIVIGSCIRWMTSRRLLLNSMARSYL